MFFLNSDLKFGLRKDFEGGLDIFCLVCLFGGIMSFLGGWVGGIGAKRFLNKF